MLLELAPDIELPPEAIIIDRHGERAGAEQPTSIEQVFALLGRPACEWTRQQELIAANDRGHIEAMAAAGASVAEMRSIRAADRRAQGVSDSDEAAAAAAIAAAEIHADGALTVFRLPHRHSSAVTDKLDARLGGPGYSNLLVCCPDSVDFYGRGELVLALARNHTAVGGAEPFPSAAIGVRTRRAPRSCRRSSNCWPPRTPPPPPRTRAARSGGR